MQREVTHTLDGTGGPAVTFRQQRIDQYAESEVAPALKQRDYKDATDLVCIDGRSLDDQGDILQDKKFVGCGLNYQPIVCFQQNTRDEVRLMNGDGKIAGAISAQPGMKQQNYMAGSGVRRLTPRECERLQSLPDDHTLYASDGSTLSDSTRYKMCGNSVATVCLSWIGARIRAVDSGEL